jgi:hypothetical protein
MAHLARVGEVSDHTGKASTMLAATIGYPGSSIAFAQLLTGMERAGLIQREIRGKRTYRIIPGPAAPPPGALTQPAPAPGAHPGAAPAPDGGARSARDWTRPASGPAQPAPGPAGAPGGTVHQTGAAMAETPETGAPAVTAQRANAAAAAVPETGAPAGTAQRANAAVAETPETGARAETGPAGAGLNLPGGPGGLDYDELARRLLVQVVRRLAGPDAGPAHGDRDAADPGGTDPGGTDQSGTDQSATDGSAATGSAQPGQPEPHETALQETVASLERKLASATTRQRRLAEENSRLRQQLRAAEQSLAEAQDRATAEVLAGRFDSAEVLLLERLLSPLREARRRTTEADAG